MWLGEVSWTSHAVELRYGIDSHAFATRVEYGPEVDMFVLEARYKKDLLQSVFFHMLAFEAIKVLSFGPKTFDPGPHVHRITPEFLRLWQIVGHKVSAQWRFQHDRPDYHGPCLLVAAAAASGPKSSSPVTLKEDNNNILTFCGGGKDSLVAMKLFERSSIPYTALVYSHSAYGLSTHQHHLADQLLDTCQPASRHRQCVSDTFFEDSTELLCTKYQVHHLFTAETPASVFNSLPLVLSQRYRHIALGHERSADNGNLIWSRTGEEVNHQWGKSLDAQKLVNTYIQHNLITNLTYFSPLKPVYDVLIFAMLNQDPTSTIFTHSCNRLKPWCKRCPKCAYVWLNYMAYLPLQTVHTIFGHDNLLDYDENQLSFRQMLGLEAHTPFECIGQVPEARLAFELLKIKGVSGSAMDVYKTCVPPQNWEDIIARFAGIVEEDDCLPADLAKKILPLMERAGANTRALLRRFLSHTELDSTS